jgi:hypothetical protein
MNNEVLFKEQQRFKQWWIWLILILINGLFVFGIIKQVVWGEQFGDNPMSNLGLCVGFGMTVLFSLFLISLRLDTIIKNDGVYVRFFPFHLKFKRYAWETLTKLSVRDYSPIKEYGGWGVRFSLFGKGTAYNVSGNKGLQLEFTSGKKLLIGTNNSEQLSSILVEINQLKE